MFICERACIYACVRCFPSLSSTLPFEKGHFTESELHLLTRLAGQWTPRCFCLCLPRVGVTEGHPRSCLFMWVLRSNSSSRDWIPNRLLLKPSLPLLINHFFDTLLDMGRYTKQWPECVTKAVVVRRDVTCNCCSWESPAVPGAAAEVPGRHPGWSGSERAWRELKVSVLYPSLLNASLSYPLLSPPT